MRLVLDGKINSLYVQSLCMMFFRGERFPINEENPRGEAFVKTIDTEQGIKCYAHISYDGKSAERESFVAFDAMDNYERSSKIAVGQAVLGACTKITGKMPPWGLLTGIRPSVVARSLIERLGTSNALDILQKQYLVSFDKAELALAVAENEDKIFEKYDDTTCSVYISIPFCPTRCNYCSFISYATKKLFEQIPSYINKLICDIQSTFALIKKLGFGIKTVYIGGGTPTTLTAAQLELILSTVQGCLGDMVLDEFTVECGRPDTITIEKLNTLKKYGVTRVSVNPQSLNDDVLNKIGRHHTVKDFFDAYELVKNVGFDAINTDLIAGLDGDSFESFKNTVDSIIALSPDNVTVHSFSVKKSAQALRDNANIYHRDGEVATRSVDYAYKALVEAGYIPYYMYRQKNTISDLENVGYAKPGAFGIYNVLMMGDGHTVFGVGAGATTKLIKNINGKREILRIFFPKYPYEYLQDNQNVEAKAIDFLKGESNNEND